MMIWYIDFKLRKMRYAGGVGNSKKAMERERERKCAGTIDSKSNEENQSKQRTKNMSEKEYNLYREKRISFATLSLHQ